VRVAAGGRAREHRLVGTVTFGEVQALGTATVAAFSSATLSHLDRAADIVAWQEVGAPFQVRTSSRQLPPTLDPAVLPGVTDATSAYRATVAIGNRGARIELLAIEPVTYTAVVRGTGAETALPAGFVGTGSGPIPAIISRDVGPASRRVELGDIFELSVESRRVSFRAVALSDAFPGIATGVPFAVAARDSVAAAVPDGRLPETTAFLRAPDSAAPDLREALAGAGRNLELDSMAERSAAFRDSPISRAVTLGVALASGVAAAYAALAVAAALALAGAARALEMAHLRTIGLTRREAAALGLSEHGPTVVVAFGAGAALGLGLFMFLKSGLGLTAIVGSTREIPLQLEIGQLAFVLAGIVMIMVVGIGLSIALGARATPAAAVRRGIE
jgi:putative ABC transport system permease protein